MQGVQGVQSLFRVGVRTPGADRREALQPYGDGGCRLIGCVGKTPNNWDGSLKNIDPPVKKNRFAKFQNQLKKP
jgi:hypothetical protein